MPTEAEKGAVNYDLVNLTLTEHFSCWTDDLPVCQLSGVGSATNQIYMIDKVRKEAHEFEDRSFHIRLDEETSFYGVFDGQNGCRAVEFASQRIPAEVLLGQLKGKESDLEINDVLQQAFLTVESAFFQSIDSLLAEKENLRLQLQGLQRSEALEKYPEAVHKLDSVEREISSETAAVVALIHKNKLYVANVGNCRAVLCKEDELGCLKACQLTIDHDFENEDEKLRLCELGISYESLVTGSKKHIASRCIGNYTVKGGYKEYNNFSDAIQEPVIAEPEVVGGIVLDDSCRFLFLMSNGLHKSLEEATGTENPNHMVAKMLSDEFSKQFTLNAVAQAVVDKAVQIHQETYNKSELCRQREDITLLVHNFNQQFPSMGQGDFQLPKTAKEDKVNVGMVHTLDAKPFYDVDTLSDVPSIENSVGVTGADCLSSTNIKDSISSSSGSFGPQRLFQSTNSVSLDDEGRIKPYVDFSEFYDLVEKAYQQNLVPEDWKRCNND